MNERYMYVSPDLNVWIYDRSVWHMEANPDIAVAGVCYRYLNKVYFAWIRRQMRLLEELHAEGKVSDASFNLMNKRFNWIKDYAEKKWGKEHLYNIPVPLRYIPPTLDQEGLPVLRKYTGTQLTFAPATGLSGLPQVKEGD